MFAKDLNQPVGILLREWRTRRRLSQLDLACEAQISTRHLSFLETGRAMPSREMVLHLAEQLNVPLRERNTLLVAAGYAPMFKERSLEDPSLNAARKAIDLVLTGHEPNPALAVDRHWNLVTSNRAVFAVLAGVESSLLTPPINVLRLTLHPKGLASQIANYGQWRAHLFMRLRHQIEVSADAVLAELLNELSSYPVPSGAKLNGADDVDYGGMVVPFQLQTGAEILSFFSTTTVFGTPLDITLSELAIESFFPADSATSEYLNQNLKREK
jgi:transcriptional regulator with XRE-family HTH domain